ncbi:MAG TPA: peptide-methionine (S)-S-oxide reductase MsrA [Ramlibacter sp.]|uniref:peptide-methionine (S)-S-oxide reductase MsrA n=1 Tax=Ramlibacter sp. TaxID=1917967 RepID=UPI002C336B8E|nr:peptide-methionine (S)-S-oxide reductase MsrA [Ramlibacter sp.]HVZ46639.1 peptide-methionine (S)-S-oxide reductase MsrA [Ramlibacter sp.]
MTTESIVLGGGCFWCTEAVFKEVRGIVDVESGYSNGRVPHPSYEQVCSGTTGHAEVVKLQYDPERISVRQILEIFFTVHDPTQLNRQGNDTGTQYRGGIYYTTEAQKREAEAIISELARDKVYARPIVTEVQPLANYWPAEEYHQDFFEKNPFQGYCVAVAAPKVEKFRKTFQELAKA